MPKISKLFFVVVLVFFSVSFFYVLYPFIAAIFLAFVLGFLFKKPHEFFVRKTNAKLAPFLSTALVFGTVIFPFFLVIFLISIEANRNYSLFITKINESYLLITQQIRSVPLLDEFYKQFLSSGDDEGLFNLEKVLAYIDQGFSYLFTVIRDGVLNLGGLIISFFIILYLFFFICKDYRAIKNNFYSFIPLSQEEKEHFFEECRKIISAVILGIFLVGIIEGTYGMLLFVILDIPSPVTWGVIMTVFSMLPILGTNTILVPLMIYKIITGEYLAVLIILVFGVGVILLSQNVVKPKLVGDKAGLHPAIVAMSSLGGLVVMGMLGILIGPICATLFIVSWKELRKKISLENLENQKS